MASLATLFAPAGGALPGAAAYLARAEARVAPGKPERTRAAAIGDVAVIGAGTMGRDIALALVQSGRRVMLIDPDRGTVERAAARIRHVIGDDVPGLTATSDPAAIRPVDMVIEAVPERLDLKIAVLGAAAARLPAGTLLATNTSTLDLDAIATALPAPERVIGTHFFMPAHVTRLLELVPARSTAPEVIAAARGLAADLGKLPVIAGNCDGFIGNRMFDRFHQEAMYLVEEGAWPEAVDRALEDWGFRIGPFRALDMIGNDIPWGVRCERARRNPALEQPLVGDRLCETGLMGQKTGRGWYFYDNGSRRGRPYEECRALVLRVSAALELARRSFPDAEVVERCLIALILEAARILDEGMAEAASDIDLVFATGYGFPAAMGGPLYLGSALGAAQIRTRAAALASAVPRHAGRWSVRDGLETLLARVEHDAQSHV